MAHLPLLAAIATPLPSAAQTVPERVRYTCSFGTECVEDEACARTDYGFDFSGLRTTTQIRFSDPTVVISTPAEEVRGGLISTGRGHLFIGEGAGSTHLWTRDPSGAARYTVHMAEGPLTVTYLGTCTETMQ